MTATMKHSNKIVTSQRYDFFRSSRLAQQLSTICDLCGMPTGDAYSSRHLVLFLLGLALVLLVETSETLYRLDIIPVCDIIPGLDIITESDISPNIGFHRASATGVACQQGTLTRPDTWSRPFGTCICSTC